MVELKSGVSDALRVTLIKYLNEYYEDYNVFNDYETGVIEVELYPNKNELPLKFSLDMKTLNDLKGSKLIAHLENNLINPLRNDLKKLNRVTVILSRREYESLNFLCKKYNSTCDDTIRRLIKEKFESIKEGGK